MNVNKWIIGMLVAVAPTIAVAGPGVPLGSALGSVLGSVLGISLGGVLGAPLGAIVPLASGGLVVVAAALVAGICIARRKRQR